MSKCDLNVVLETPDVDFKPGDVVRGFITVEVNAPVNCRGLHVQFLVRTHGRGNRWEDIAAQTVAFEGEWKAGQEQLYPFEFTVPPGPITYSGNVLNVSWYIHAYVDIPWAFDPKVLHEVIVVPGDDGQRLSLGPGQDTSLLDPETRQQAGAIAATVGAVVVGGVGTIGAVVIGSSLGAGAAGLVLIPVAALSAGILFLGWRNPLAAKRLGEVDFSVASASVQVGEAWQFDVSLTPPKPTAVTAITLELKAEEVVVSGSGTNTTTHRHTAFEQTIPLHSGGDIVGPTSFSQSVALAQTAPPTFRAPSNNLVWTAQLHIDVPSWPDWWRTLYLTARP